MARPRIKPVNKGVMLLSFCLAVLSSYNLSLISPVRTPVVTLITAAVAMGLTILVYSLLSRILRDYRRFWRDVEVAAPEVLLATTIVTVGGGVCGLILGIPLLAVGKPGPYLAVAAVCLGAKAGLHMGKRRGKDLITWIREVPKPAPAGIPKVLDTSAIIDGRIYDIVLTHFLEGPIIVPSFVIEELRHIADSSDYLRRSKGRRGLDILNKIQKTSPVEVEIWQGDFPEEREVDMKLLRLCREIDASIVTNDYNLNKVAELQNIKVLNVNELANAVKVMVFPGETMRVSIIKEGKEEGQGVGYLEDGTMVVVENGENEIGSQAEVVVTSVFQTAAGRMIFTRRVKDREGAGPAVSRGDTEVNMVVG